jgi:WD40 repeat protein
MYFNGAGRDYYPTHLQEINACLFRYVLDPTMLASMACVCRAWWRLARDVAGYRTMVLRSHKIGVSCVTSIPASNQLVSGSFSGTIKIWDLSSGNALVTVDAHIDSVNALAVLSGNRFASCSSDGVVKLWDLAALLAPLEVGVGLVSSVASVSRGVNCMLNGAVADPAVVERAMLVNLRMHVGPVWAVAALPSDQLVSGSKDGKAILWDIGSDPKLAVFSSQDGILDDASLPPPPTAVFVAATLQHTAAVHAFAVLPHLDWLAVGQQGLSPQRVTLWDLVSHAIVGEIGVRCPFAGAPPLAALTGPSGHPLLAVGGSDGSVVIFEVVRSSSGQAKFGVHGTVGVVNGKGVEAVVAVPGGAHEDDVLIATAGDGVVTVWADFTSRCDKFMAYPKMTLHSRPTGQMPLVCALGVVGNDGVVAAGAADSTISLWRVANVGRAAVG